MTFDFEDKQFLSLQLLYFSIIGLAGFRKKFKKK